MIHIYNPDKTKLTETDKYPLMQTLLRVTVTLALILTLMPATASAAFTGDLTGLKATAAAGGVYTLSGEIYTDKVYTIGTNTAALIVGSNLTINLNGKTLTIVLSDATDSAAAFVNELNAIIRRYKNILAQQFAKKQSEPEKLTENK